MVENAIQHDMHAAGVGLIQQHVKDRIFTEDRVHMPVVVCVITMVDGGHEDRIEINRINPKVLQIIQFFIDSQQVTALSPGALGSIPGFNIGRFFK